MSYHDAPVPLRKLMLLDVEDGSYREFRPTSGQQSSEKGFEQKKPVPGFPYDAHQRILRGETAPDRVSQGLDPWTIVYEWPERWREYLHAHFRNHMLVAQAFSVSEPAARKWWDGVGSCRGDKVAMACRMHPETAPQMLFGEAA